MLCLHICIHIYIGKFYSFRRYARQGSDTDALWGQGAEGVIYIYIYVYVYIYLFIYVCKYMCVCECVCKYICMCIYIYMNQSIYIHLFIFIYMHMYVYIYMFYSWTQPSLTPPVAPVIFRRQACRVRARYLDIYKYICIYL